MTMYTTTPYHQFHYVREELATIPTNVKEEDDTAAALVQNTPLRVSKILVFSMGMLATILVL